MYLTPFDICNQLFCHESGNIFSSGFGNARRRASYTVEVKNDALSFRRYTFTTSGLASICYIFFVVSPLSIYPHTQDFTICKLAGFLCVF
jgi:hypothetical protein